MTQTQKILAEVKREAVATRKILQAVPLDKADWKPHPKSMALGRLATHIAEILGWYEIMLNKDVLDFAAGNFTPRVVKDSVELLDIFDKNMIAAEAILASFPDERMQENWTMRAGEQVFFTLTKEEVVRTWCLNHWYHHRAQLGVYLRLLDLPLPGTYGPSADNA